MQISWEMVKAVSARGAMFVSEMPTIKAHFDNGQHQGTVKIIKAHSTVGYVIVSLLDTDTRYTVELSSLSIDEATAAHLEAAADVIRNWVPLTYRYSAGTQHFGKGGQVR